MQTELHELKNRYDDLLLIENKSDAEFSEIEAIEARIQRIVFPSPHRKGEDQ